MCADEARAVSYRHTPDIGWLKVPLPAGRRLVETSREVPDTLPSSFRWRCPGGYRRMTRADEGIRPLSAPIHHQAKRKRISKNSPFDNHPEVSTSLAIAAQDP